MSSGWIAAGAWLDERQDTGGRGVAGQAVGEARWDTKKQPSVTITADAMTIIITTNVCF